ncbi:hypothetical protein [Cytobacillus sp. FSL H8-0458]|uniref:hypothetical protein n=1 Tax=Cytobacillus sp. FSL H8-0458 TaxID=2975346 RepID=UPI0030F509FE
MKFIANHSGRLLKLDLQYFAEDEDFILPDDFEAETVEPEVPEAVSEESFEEPLEEPAEETEQTEELTEQQQEEQRQAFLKVKYNKEEMDLDEDTARELAQKGLNYDKVQERLQALESDPRLSFVEELAKEQGMTTEQYLEAVQEYKEQEKLNELIQQNIPEELAKEILETRKMREEIQSEKQAKVEEQRKNAEFQEFFDYYKQAQGKDFDPNKDQIPPEVWQMNQNGVPLKYAFMEHHSNQLLSQIQVLKQNKENEQRAPIGSLTNHGSTEVASEDDFLKGFNSI